MQMTRTPRIILALAALAVGVAVLPGAAATATDGSTDSINAKASVRDVNNNFLGTVTITQVSSTKLVVAGRLTGIAAGFHGFHIHSVGICNPTFVDPTGAVVPFGSAGGHLNPAGATHGHHAGDLPSLLVAADGSAIAVVQTDAVTLAQIFDADGAAFIVHAGADNFANIPSRYVASATGVPGPDAATLATGDSGSRFACGVIVKA
ncbi:MAG TPA: superoxide dismutase family protein [Micromonosporaceae bacterium]|jgi:Cu-Zn family superoxide dismutase|nr:superoxide dismutase family protein [Micromonosporaceae bacterium]